MITFGGRIGVMRAIGGVGTTVGIGDMPTLGDCLRPIRAGDSAAAGESVVLRTGGVTTGGDGPCERRRRVLGNDT